jgi:hypothetical protein
MNTTIYQQRETRERHRMAEATHSGDTFPPPLGGRPDSAYERFLEMPVPLVLASLWLGGVTLVGTCVLALYALVATVIGA